MNSQIYAKTQSPKKEIKPASMNPTTNEFQDGFRRFGQVKNDLIKPGVLYGSNDGPLNELLDQMMKGQGKKEVPTGEDLISQIMQNGKNVDIMTPTSRVRTVYEFEMVYTSSEINLFTGELKENVDSVTFKIRDRTEDEDCPGRFFINCKFFLEEAAALYASDPQYLDHQHAWLPKDIKRYAQDIARFFGGDPNDTTQLEKQIDQYIRHSADASMGDDKTIAFTISGIDFSATDFVEMISYLKTSLNGDISPKAIQQYGNTNLTDHQTELLLSTQNKWETYSKWAQSYGHDQSAFLFG